MPTPLIGAAITGGASLIGGLLGKKKQTVTSTPTYTGEQMGLQSQLAATLKDRLANPTNLDPLRTAAASDVNRQFSGAQAGLERRLAARGFGNSGPLVTNTKSLAIARAGALGDLTSKFAGLQIDQNNKAVDDAQRFAFAGPSQTQTQSGPGALAGAVSGGAETASLLYALNHFMGGGSGTVGDVPGGNATYTGGSDLLRSVGA